MNLTAPSSSELFLGLSGWSMESVAVVGVATLVVLLALTTSIICLMKVRIRKEELNRPRYGYMLDCRSGQVDHDAPGITLPLDMLRLTPRSSIHERLVLHRISYVHPEVMRAPCPSYH